jgi:hypothetical protein
MIVEAAAHEAGQMRKVLAGKFLKSYSQADNPPSCKRFYELSWPAI